MVRVWGTNTKNAEGMSKAALGELQTGNIAVVIRGETLDHALTILACRIAKEVRRKVHLVHIIEVPRTFHLQAALPQASEHADRLLNQATHVAERVGCEAVVEVVQARHTGRAIVEEAKYLHCCLLLIGSIRKHTYFTTQNEMDDTILYVLTNASCRVWLIQDTECSSDQDKEDIC